MKRITVVVLVLVAMVHYGGDPLSLNYRDPPAAARAIYYIARSFEGATQYFLIGLLAIVGRCRGKPRDVVLFVAACAWGLSEQAEAGVCRLAKGIENHPHPGLWRGVCDDLTGLPFYSIGLAVGAGLAVAIAMDLWENKNA